MKGPFLLPEDTQEGDWIEIGMLGAYGSTMQTRFNGFHSEVIATVWPEAAPFAFERPRAQVTVMAGAGGGNLAPKPVMPVSHPARTMAKPMKTAAGQQTQLVLTVPAPHDSESPPPAE